MTIYLDIVFLENIIMNYIILFGTAIISKLKLKNSRIVIASIVGAIYAIVEYISILKIYSTIILKIVLSIIIIYIAFNPKNLKTMLKELLFFYLTSFVFGGTVLSLIYIVNPNSIIIKNGVFIGTYPIVITILGAVVGLIIIIISLKNIRNKISNKSFICNITIHIENKTIKTRAMIDTGNLLKEPITNIPVVVLERSLLYDVLPKQILYNLENILGGDLKSISDEIKEKYILKLKVIPFSSLGKQHGMMLGIKADEIIIESEEEIVKKENIIVGIYDKSLTKKGEYKALVGMNLL